MKLILCASLVVVLMSLNGCEGGRHTVPAATGATFEADMNRDCIQAWLASSRPKHKRLLRGWIKEHQLSEGITELIFFKEYAAARATVVKDLNIPCN